MSESESEDHKNINTKNNENDDTNNGKVENDNSDINNETARNIDNEGNEKSNHEPSTHHKRTNKRIDRLAAQASRVCSKENNNVEHYNETMGRVITRMMWRCVEKYECTCENKIQLAQTYSLKKGLRLFRACYFGI